MSPIDFKKQFWCSDEKQIPGAKRRAGNFLNDSSLLDDHPSNLPKISEGAPSRSNCADWRDIFCGLRNFRHPNVCARKHYNVHLQIKCYILQSELALGSAICKKKRKGNGGGEFAVGVKKNPTERCRTCPSIRCKGQGWIIRWSYSWIWSWIFRWIRKQTGC